MKAVMFTNSTLGKLFYKIYKNRKFTASEDYWEQRYAKGGNSGAGSYSKLAEFKAKILNDFVEKQNINSLIEFGCGDGNQLQLAKYKNYIGLDVSKTTLQNCIKKFSTDSSKSFFLYNTNAFVDKHGIFKAELTLSLDVIYHLVEDDVFDIYMKNLFSSSNKFVIIYSSNNDGQHSFHVRERKFTNWVDKNAKDWKLVEIIKNKYPFDPNDPINTSIADFFIYQRII